MLEIGDPYPRKKASCVRAGFDPDMKELRRLHAIRSSQEKRMHKAIEAHQRACASVDYYWERTFAAIDEKEGTNQQQIA